jgi:hypothetical protein
MIDYIGPSFSVVDFVSEKMTDLISGVSLLGGSLLMLTLAGFAIMVIVSMVKGVVPKKRRKYYRYYYRGNRSRKK